VQCQPADRPRARPGGDRPPTRPARPLAGSVTDNDKRRRQTTDTNKQNNTGPLGGPVINPQEIEVMEREFTLTNRTPDDDEKTRPR